MLERLKAGVGAVVLVLFIAVDGVAFAATAPAASLNSYAAYLGGPAHSSYVQTATTFTNANSGRAHSIWTWTPSGYLTASPIVNAGVIYIGSENGDFYAINASTGAVKWTKKLTISNCKNSGIVSSATVAKDPVTGKLTVYVGAGDHYLYALNASNGTTMWRTLIGGAGIDYYNWSSPTVADGYIYYGVATACDVAGNDGVVALNQHTGAQTGRYYTSGSASVEGASVYTSAAVAPDGSVFVTTGDDNGASTNDSTAIVKLAEGTLTRLGGYVIPGLIGLNMDFNASPTLFMMGTTPMVGACDKDGVFYALTQASLNTNQTATAWQTQLGIPPVGNSLAFCGGSAVYDGSHLFVGADASTATAPPGSMYELDTSGTVVWETPLGTGPVVGTPSLDGDGVLAVPTYNSIGGTSAVYLIDKTNGSTLKTIDYSGPIFAQPVFADGELLVAGPTLRAYVP
jgi:polyvinyl alcohol dehydrogenase (cytochrome)